MASRNDSGAAVAAQLPFGADLKRTSWLAGILLCVGLAGAATYINDYTAVPTMLGVLLLGMGVRFGAPEVVGTLAPGIAFSGKCLLRVGVALLGLRVVASDIIALGWPALVLILASLGLTVGIGFAVARLFRQPTDTASIAATSVAVCGASAALAASAVAPPREGLERDTTIIIITVSLLSTAVMLVYPPLATALGYNPLQTSLLLGASIHDVAQVVGAGFAVSPEVGVVAITVKLLRVACLLPVILIWGMVHARCGELNSDGGDGAAAPPGFPLFLVGFLVLAILASAGLVPSAASELAKTLANWLLAAAVAAIGLKTSLADLRTASPRLLAALVGQTLIQLGVVITLISFLYPGA